jgi:hypothetical protein
MKSLVHRGSIPFDSSLCMPGPSRGGWNARLESWWRKRIIGFPGGLPNAIWHTPDATARRMLWLERKVRKYETKND